MYKAYRSLINNLIWARTNSVELFNIAQQKGVLDYLPHYTIKNKDIQNRTVLYQFQCMLTTTNARIRRLRNDEEQQFGVLIT